MARIKADDLAAYMKADSPFWQTAGLQVTEVKETFKASPKGSDEKFVLDVKFRKVAFPDLSIATAAFGNTANLLRELAESVNEALAIQAKNKVKAESLGFETKVAEAVNAAIAQFTSQRGVNPTDEQRTKIKARVRERLEMLAKLEKETEQDIANL